MHLDDASCVVGKIHVYNVDAGSFCGHIILCKGQACDIIRGGVRAQVENTRGTNYPFLHGIIAGDRDKAIRACAVYKSLATIAWKLVADKSRIRERRHARDFNAALLSLNLSNQASLHFYLRTELIN